MKRLTICVLVLLAGCSLSPKPVTAPPDRPRLDQADSADMSDCAWPVAIKVATLTQKQLEDSPLGDNADLLIDCWKKHHRLVNFIRNRDAGLTGAAKP